jgi:hypothetical protein
MASDDRDKVFISYSRTDKVWLDRLLMTLGPLSQAKPNTIWWDGRIEAGQKWEEEIGRTIGTARVAVFLASPAFLASEFIMKDELPRLLDAASRDGLRVLWSLVRHCWWKNSPLAAYQSVPAYQEGMKPWNARSEADLDELLVNFAQTIAAGLTAVPPAPRVAAEPPPPTSCGSSEPHNARRLLQGVDDVRTMDEIGDLFVLRHCWADAHLAYDCLIEQAAPYREAWMARGYEKLGAVHRKQQREISARESWRLAQILYRRSGKAEKAAEMDGLLQAPVAFAAAPQGPSSAGAVSPS